MCEPSPAFFFVAFAQPPTPESSFSYTARDLPVLQSV